MSVPAVLDTCVLYPMYLRRALVREGAASSDQAERIITLMRVHFPESEVAGYESLTVTMTCHPKDRHVLAAAVKAGSALLVTDNNDDFPPESTEPYGVEVLTSDQFLLEFLDASPATVIRTLGRQAERY